MPVVQAFAWYSICGKGLTVDEVVVFVLFGATISLVSFLVGLAAGYWYGSGKLGS